MGIFLYFCHNAFHYRHHCKQQYLYVLCRVTCTLVTQYLIYSIPLCRNCQIETEEGQDSKKATFCRPEGIAKDWGVGGRWSKMLTTFLVLFTFLRTFAYFLPAEAMMHFFPPLRKWWSFWALTYFYRLLHLTSFLLPTYLFWLYLFLMNPFKIAPLFWLPLFWDSGSDG